MVYVHRVTAAAEAVAAATVEAENAFDSVDSVQLALD